LFQKALSYAATLFSNPLGAIIFFSFVRLLDDGGLLSHFHYTLEDLKRKLILFDLEKLEEIALMRSLKSV
jgi:hypothetical protein